jgi:phage terminase large subunit-like protein
VPIKTIAQVVECRCELYEGTRLGRQELQGAMILDPVDAVFRDDWLIHDVRRA